MGQLACVRHGPEAGSCVRHGPEAGPEAGSWLRVLSGNSWFQGQGSLHTNGIFHCIALLLLLLLQERTYEVWCPEHAQAALEQADDTAPLLHAGFRPQR